MGYVYLLTHPLLDGWCKVGFTNGDPADRATALSTGLPGKLHVAASWAVADARAAESTAHKALRRYRTRQDKEWFRCPPATALAAVERALGHRPARTLPRWALLLLGFVAGCYIGAALW